MRTCSLLCLLAAASLPATALAGSRAPVPKLSASSSHDSGTSVYSPELAFDGVLGTSWAEGVPGDGAEEWIEVDLGEDRSIAIVSIWAGAFDGKESWSGRGRGAELTVSGTGPDGDFSKSVEIGDRYARKDVRLGKNVRTLRITLDSVHKGSVFDSTHIAEVAFDFHDPGVWEPILAAATEAIDAEVAKSKTTRELPEEEPLALKDAYLACKDNAGYSDNFKVIEAVAINGWQWRMPLVQKHVPLGYRRAALQFEEKAIGYLVKLKDPNAIGTLETAAAGTQSSDDRDWLYLEVKFLLAEQTLRRGLRATVPQWGSEGFEKGAFKSRGEAMSIDVDSGGNLYVTDPGNNRVQRFTAAGSIERVIGGERGIAQWWFGDKNADPYATAGMPGTEAGQFQQPYALAVGNYDILAVIDVALRVQTFDAEGKPKATWTIDKDWKPKSGRGAGTPIITWLDDDFLFIIKDEVITYTADGELKTRYTLEGGDVQAAVISAGGKLIVRHAATRELIEYKPQDGFRQGTWGKKGVPDDGSEDWDLCSDGDDNLYVVTDAGNVHKWNKRGKFISTVAAFENPRDMPRCAVNGPIVYIAAKDEIVRVQQED
jgi:hypothetical protein